MNVPQRRLLPLRDPLRPVEPFGEREEGEDGGCFPGGQDSTQGEAAHGLQSGRNEEPVPFTSPTENQFCFF